MYGTKGRYTFRTTKIYVLYKVGLMKNCLGGVMTRYGKRLEGVKENLPEE